MDQELKAYLDQRFAGMEERFTGMEERFTGMEKRLTGMEQGLASVDQRFAGMEVRLGKVETEVRHTGVLVEGMHDNVRLLAEGLVGASERIDALRRETTVSLEEIKGSVTQIHQILVPRVQGLEYRLKILEDKAERENRDIIEVLRERLLRPAQ